MKATAIGIGVLTLFCASGLAMAAQSTVVGFDGGTNGGFQGNAFFEATNGNPGGNAHHLVEAFGMELRTGAIGEPSNPDFLGDYSAFPFAEFSVDVNVNQLTFFGTPVSRNLGIVLIDRDIQGPSGASGVWLPLGTISSSLTPDWTTLSYLVDDPTQTTLPTGAIGFGDEDPNTFEPILPAGATFASVMAGVDEMRVTTFEPGFFFGFTIFDVRVDNVSLTVPAPSTAATLMAFGAFGLRRRR